MPSSLGGKWIVWYAVVLHGLWGALVLYDPQHAVWITAIATSVKVVGDPYLLGALYVIASGLSIVACFRRDDLVGACLAVPQQFFLMTSAIGAVRAIVLSQFADGVDRPWAFIAADQLPAILAAVLHSAALVEVYIWGRMFPAPTPPQSRAP